MIPISVSEEVWLSKKHGSERFDLVLEQMLEYIHQFEECTENALSEEDQSAPGMIRGVPGIQLEADGKSIRIDDLMDMASSSALSEVKWFAEYQFMAGRFQPAYEFFDSTSTDGVSRALFLRSVCIIRDEDENEYHLFYTPFGSEEMFSDDRGESSLNDVKEVADWHADEVLLGANLPSTTDEEKLREIWQAQEEFSLKYNKDFVWDDWFDHKGRKENESFLDFTVSAKELPGFIDRLKALNDIVTSAAPDAVMILRGFLYPNDPKHPFNGILLDYDVNERQIIVSVVHLPPAE